MISGTAKNRKCYPLHSVRDKLWQPVKENLLGFHALTGCDTTSAFSGHGKKTCWKVFESQPHLVNGIGRDGDLSSVEEFVCSVFLMVLPQSQMWTKPGFNSSVKPGRALRCCLQRGMPWPCTLVVLTTIWLQADQEHIQVPSHVNTSAWIKEQDCLVPVWTRLPPIPDAYVQLVTFACKSKMSYGSMHLFQERSEVHSCLWLWRNSML